MHDDASAAASALDASAPAMSYLLIDNGPFVNHHPTLLSNATGDTLFCAHSHCRGECGFPALFYGEYKAHGIMVSCGPVWQKKPWGGARVSVPEGFTVSLRAYW